jgi:tetratricopeptide (TPR) repeat protein
MHEEREELVKHVFPQIRKLCEQRGVEWGEVDLRWGITDEQKSEGKVLPLCLSEIERCRPYFIGIIGERYGWIPQDIPQSIKQEHEWLNNHLDSSVTALEIFFGVLNDPKMADRSFFYLRDPAFINTIPEERRIDYVEMPTEEDVVHYGRDEADRQVARKKQKLTDLKEMIRKSGLPVRENYKNPKIFRDLVLKDLENLINRFYPESPQIDSLDREIDTHRSYARSRSRVYLKKQSYFDCLNHHAIGGGPPLVIFGESGSGKSALLATWGLEYQRIHPDQLVIQHFIGASDQSTNYISMLRRIMGELKRYFFIEQDIPETSDEVRAVFINWLQLASEKGRVIIIVDALNQLDDRDGASDLVWLPELIPVNIRFIFSTLPWHYQKSLISRGWPVIDVTPLSIDERRSFIDIFFKRYRKNCGEILANKIANADKCANPLFLTVLLEELRIYGDHFTLNQWADHYLQAVGVGDLFEKIFDRWENDFDKDRPKLVHDTLSFLWAARKGLSEIELLDLLAFNGKQMPRVYWSPLFLAMTEFALVNHSGLFSFFHDSLRIAVQNRYTSTEPDQLKAHHILADYFGEKDFGIRKLDEYPWQLTQAKDWNRLANQLNDPDFFLTLWAINKFEVNDYWTLIEENSKIRFLDTYQNLIHNPNHYPLNFSWWIGFLLRFRHHLNEALSINEYYIRYFRNRLLSLPLLLFMLIIFGLYLSPILPWFSGIIIVLFMGIVLFDRGKFWLDGYARAMGVNAEIYLKMGNYKLALKALKTEERIVKHYRNKNNLAINLREQASIHLSEGQFEKAMETLKIAQPLSQGPEKSKQVLAVCRAIESDDPRFYSDVREMGCGVEPGTKESYIFNLISQVTALKCLGEADKALILIKEIEQTYPEIRNTRNFNNFLFIKAIVLYDKGELETAMSLFKELEHHFRKTDEKNNLADCLNYQGTILYDKDAPEGAMSLFKEAETILNESTDKKGLGVSLLMQGIIKHNKNDLVGAMASYKEGELISRKTNSKGTLISLLMLQGEIFKFRGDYTGAMIKSQECELICRESNDNNGLFLCLGQEAEILKDTGRLELALSAYQEQERICRENTNNNGLVICLGKEAEILMDTGRLELALSAYQEQEQICRENNDNNGLVWCLGYQAMIFREWKRFGDAMELLKSQETLCYKFNNKHALQFFFGNKALVLRDLGDLEEAMRLHKEEEKICIENKWNRPLQESLGNQAVILRDWGRFDEAMQLLKQQEAICQEMGIKKFLAISYQNQALTEICMLHSDNALDAIEKAYKIASDNGYTVLIEQISKIKREISGENSSIKNLVVE